MIWAEFWSEMEWNELSKTNHEVQLPKSSMIPKHNSSRINQTRECSSKTWNDLKEIVLVSKKTETI